MTVHPAFPVDGAPMPMAPAPLTVRVVDPLSLSADLAAGWDALAAEASEPNPFVERWCLQSSLHLLDSDRQARLVMVRSEEHTSEIQTLMRISYAVLWLKKKKITIIKTKSNSKIKKSNVNTLLL